MSVNHVNSPLIRARVILYHDLDVRRQRVEDLLALADIDDRCRLIAHDLCEEILKDVENLREQLNLIELFAKDQLQAAPQG